MYVKRYGGHTKWIYFLMEGDNLLKKYNTVRYKVSTNIKKEFDKEPVCDKKFMKTKIWCFGD